MLSIFYSCLEFSEKTENQKLGNIHKGSLTLNVRKLDGPIVNYMDLIGGDGLLDEIKWNADDTLTSGRQGLSRLPRI